MMAELTYSQKWYRKLKADPERFAAFQEKNRAKAKAHYEANKDEINRRDRERFASDEDRRAKRAAWQREYRKKNREHVQTRDTALRYGISYEQAKELRSRTHCDICGIKLSRGVNGFSIDHCHDTGQVRGVLCDHCNKGLGLFRDNVDHLRSAIMYLSNSDQP